MSVSSRTSTASVSLECRTRFLRMWEYYLCYCEGAFREKQIGVAQILLQKPDNRLPPRYPALGG